MSHVEPDAEPDSIIISANPHSGAYSRLQLTQSLCDALNRAGFQCELHTDLDQVRRRIAELGPRRLRTVVSAGGDGTASLLASLVPSDVPLTIFPIGSENLLAKHFGLTTDIPRVVQSIIRQQVHRLDVFLANGQITLLLCSIGFDAEVVKYVHLNRKTHVSKWNYVWGILITWFRYRWPLLSVECFDAAGTTTHCFHASWLFAFNVARYASRIRLIESTHSDDGLLEVGYFPNGGPLRGLFYYLCVAFRLHRYLTNWRTTLVHGMRVRLAESVSKNAASSYQIDGDWGRELPLEIQYAGRKLQLIAQADLDSTG